MLIWQFLQLIKTTAQLKNPESETLHRDTLHQL